MIGKLFYLLICAATTYVGILYYSPTLLGLAALEYLLPTVSGLLLWIGRRRIRIAPCLPLGVAEKNQAVSVGIELEAKNWIPIPRIRVQLKISNGFYKDSQTIELWGMADGRGKTRITTSLSSSRCGPLLLELTQVRLYDIFRLFSKKVPLTGQETLAVLPEYYMANVRLQESTRAFLVESEVYDKEKPGDDPSEIFQVREYRGGDRLQSVHWKISARTDELMVKEYSLPLANSVLLFFDMQVLEQQEGSLDEGIEAVLAISYGLLEAGCEHYVIWYDKGKKDLERMGMKTQEDLYAFTERMFAAGPYEEAVSLEELYQEKYRGETWHTKLLLNTRCELWQDGEWKMSLAGHAREELENGELLI